jgi:hypothetical protein
MLVSSTLSASSNIAGPAVIAASLQLRRGGNLGNQYGGIVAFGIYACRRLA